MKHTIKLLIVFAAIGFVSCEADFENPVTEGGFYTSGTADFSKYVAVGNSLTAGIADGALYITSQENSYPNIMAGQFALVGGGEFTQPLMDDNLGGLLKGGQQIASNRLVLAFDANGDPGPVTLEGVPTTDVATSVAGPYNNMGVPGAKSFHLNANGYGAANPFYERFQTSANASVIEDAASIGATFFSLWIGNNDVLSYATSGGSGVDQTGNTDLSTYGDNDITDPAVFASVYSQQVSALTAGGAKGALGNIADVTSAAFFTALPPQSIPLDAATAAFLTAGFAKYNTEVLPGLAGLGIITPAEAAARMVNFTAGVNFPIITDNDLTDITAILQGPPFSVPAPTAALLGQLRQVNSNELILLTAASQLGSMPDPSNPTGIVGLSIPVANQFVLTEAEQARIAAATDAYNAAINALAIENDLAYVDVKTALAEVADTGVSFDGGVITSEFVTGGTFSLDGFHPTPRGYAYTANEFIKAINRKYDATVPMVDIGNYGTVTLTNNGG